MNLFEAVDAQEEAQTIVDERKQTVEEIVRPVLAAFGHEKDGFEGVILSPTEVIIEYGYGCRGYCYFHDLLVPRYIFESDDPGEAAKKFVEERNAEKARIERQEKLAQIERLQKELNQ